MGVRQLVAVVSEGQNEAEFLQEVDAFLDLFDGDGEKIDAMNRALAADFGFTECFDVCGQTYPRKLEMYKSFLSPGAEIRFKTDDDGLFEESVEYFGECGYEITFITRDLHNSGFEGNIMTEHEKMFMDEGKTIKFLIAKQK